VRQTPQTCTFTRILISARLGNVAVDEAQGALGGRRRVIKRPGPHAAAEPDPAEADPSPEAAEPDAGSRAEATKLGDIGHEMHGEALEDVRRYVVQIGAIAGREEDLGQPGAMSGEQLLLHSADREHATVQGDSPVMPTSERTGRPEARDARAATIVTPADGPSLGTAPAGTCKWMAPLASRSVSYAESVAMERRYDRAIWADSFMTSPSWPGKHQTRARPP